MDATPVAVIDALNSLLEAEQQSVFRFMRVGSPYLSRATVDLRQPLEQMAEAADRHSAQLADLITDLGGTPLPAGPRVEDQYLAYLSLKFLLPKLVESKQLTVDRYENLLATLQDPPPRVLDLLNRHQADHRDQLRTLRQAMESVLK